MNLNSMAKLSLFETNIRILGGLLAAFDLSQDTRLLNKARDLADRLLPNFDLATTGKPCPTVSWQALVGLTPAMTGENIGVIHGSQLLGKLNIVLVEHLH